MSIVGGLIYILLKVISLDGAYLSSIEAHRERKGKKRVVFTLLSKGSK